LAPLISAIGMSILLQTIAMLIWSRNPMTYPQLLPSTPIELGGTGATITGKEIVIIFVALAVMCGLLFLVEKTKLGRAMRATAEQTQIASLMGVNPNRVISITFMLGGALSGLGWCNDCQQLWQCAFLYGLYSRPQSFYCCRLGRHWESTGRHARWTFIGFD
jgi:branched-chain amino acid transport system permease protein